MFQLVNHLLDVDHFVDRSARFKKEMEAVTLPYREVEKDMHIV